MQRPDKKYRAYFGLPRVFLTLITSQEFKLHSYLKWRTSFHFSGNATNVFHTHAMEGRALHFFISKQEYSYKEIFTMKMIHINNT